MKPFLLTVFALISFALNSILCRLALRGDEADAVGFTTVRLVSGALLLTAIFCASPRVSKGDTSDTSMSEGSPLLTRGLVHNGSWLSAFFLFAYAIAFSLAYLNLTAGTGALILFGSVQLTMIAVSLIRGERPSIWEWFGLFLAVGGLVYLVFPGLESPPLVSSMLMAAAGTSWGFYTLRGKGSGDPLSDTAGNFIRSIPMIGIVAVAFLSQIHLSTRGIVLAVISGAITSGIGYAVWYAALKYHTATRAAVLQLSVPVIAAILGVVLLAESANTRLLIAAALVLGGIGLTIFGKKPVSVART